MKFFDFLVIQNSLLKFERKTAKLLDNDCLFSHLYKSPSGRSCDCSCYLASKIISILNVVSIALGTLMTIHAIKRFLVTLKIISLLIVGAGLFSSIVRAEVLGVSADEPVVHSDYLTWNSSDLSYWLNQYVGVGLEQRQLLTPNRQETLTSTNLVVGTQLSERFIVSGNAGFLSWPTANSEYTSLKSKQSIYWGISTRWRLNNQVSLKAQWQQIEFDEKEQRLIMGVDVKLSF